MVRTLIFFLKIDLSDFPCGRVDKNSTANAGDEVSIPGLRRFCILGSSQAHAPQLQKPVPTAYVPQQEKPPQQEAHALQRRVAPARCNQRKPTCSKDPAQPKSNNKKKRSLKLRQLRSNLSDTLLRLLRRSHIYLSSNLPLNYVCFLVP